MRAIWFGRALAIAVFVAGPGGAAWAAAGDPAGSEFQINSYTAASQERAAVAPDGAGGFVVAWMSSFGQDGSLTGIFGQRFTGSGARNGPEFQVNSYTTKDQMYPAVASDGAGGFVVAWQSDRQDGLNYGIFGQRFTGSGAPNGPEFQINSSTAPDQQYPAVAPDGAGGFVVAWQSFIQDGSNWGVFGRRFTSSGAPNGSEFEINSYTSNYQRHPAVAPDGTGGFVVAWASNTQDGSGAGVFGQRFTSSGTPNGSEFQINSYTTDSQAAPAVALDGAGGFLVVWEGSGQDGSNWGVFGQRFTSSGTRNGSEFQINSYTTSDQRFPAVALDGAGGFVVVWKSYGQDGSNWGAFGQRFTGSGAPNGLEFQINSYTTHLQDYPGVALDGAGGFVAVWGSSGQDGSGFGVFGQRLGRAPASTTPAPTLTPWGLVLAIFLLAAAGAFTLRRRRSTPVD